MTNNPLSNSFIIPSWPAPPTIKAVNTTRRGGTSIAPYHEMNLALHVGDDEEIVHKNRALLMTLLDLPEMPRWLNQVHGTHVLELEDTSDNFTADAVITATPEKICAVMTADCLPILLCNRQGTEVAAVHAGWKGLLAGVIDATLGKLTSSPQDLMAWLGPAISQKCYEVNESIRVDFINKDPHNNRCFIYREHHVFADLYDIARVNLQRLGVTKVYGGNFCTYTQQDLFYSYRRDQQITGRMASLIWITK